MKIKAVHHYAKDIETVFGLFRDPEFMQTKYVGIGARKVEVLECAGSEGRYTVKVKREVPADVPGLLKKFLNPWNSVVQSESWEGKTGGPWRCTFAIDIAGVPVTVKGAMELRAEGGGCVNDVQLEVKCGIPLVGGKLADFVSSDAEKAIQKEYEFIRAHLGQG
ncbi:MAG: DUF2505 domain-containing protein [Candidatus Competibacteraceae bacterium]